MTVAIAPSISKLRPEQGASFGRAGLLPAYRAPRGPEAASAPFGQPPEGYRKRILVVDDDPRLLEIISMTIERAGFTSDQARNGEEAWTAICNARYDLVITDHEMPVLTGLDFIMRLRTVARSQPCLLISGSTDSLDSVRPHIQPGGVLAKPFSTLELLEKIYTLLLRGGGE